MIVTGFAPDPGTLENIKNGVIASGLGVDITTEIWSQVDELARTLAKQPLSPLEKAGSPPLQMLEQSDLANLNVKTGWTGYPDYAQRFAKLWGS